MIIDRTWNKYEQRYVISYIDKAGNRKMYAKNLHHWKTYEYAENGDVVTWNNRKCSKVFKDASQYAPNEFDQLEFMYEMPKEILDQLHETNSPKMYCWDIETEVDNFFPDPDIAAQKVTAISLVGPNLDCMVFGLHNMNEDSKALFKKRYLDWVNSNSFAKKIIGDREPKVLYQYFSSESEMLKHWFTKILPNVTCLAGWNAYNFDWKYIVNRSKKIFGEGETLRMIRKISPTGEIGNIRFEVNAAMHDQIISPKHFMNVDYMLLCKQYDYILRPYESYSLDWVAEHAVDAHKIKYDGTLQQLYEKDHEWYYFYNAIDSVLTMLIHYRLKCIESPVAVSSLTLVPYQTAQGQIALTTANVFYQYYIQDRHVVWDYDAVARYKSEYEGAFVAAMPGKYNFTVCYDFKSLYPSQIQTCNFSFENIVENLTEPDSLGRRFTLPWTEEQLETYRNDPNYFVSLNNNVYRNDKDYTFKLMQKYLMLGRDKYKYLGQKIDREIIFNIGKLLANQKDECIEFSDKIVDFLKEEFPGYDIYKMSEQELKSFKEEVTIKREEYALLENAFKVSMNAAYGSCANHTFYFYDMRIAADITAECRALTKFMWDRYEKFFREDIWERKELWERFEFELDENKKEHLIDCNISCYSDTDSVYVTYYPFFKCMTKEYQEKYKTKEQKRDWILNFNDKFMNGQNGIWLDEMYGKRNAHNVHVFEMEAINFAQIVLKKKKYVKAVMINKGKVYEKPKVSGTGVEIIKSTTPPLCRTILTEMIHSLLFDDISDKDEYIYQFNEVMSKYKKDFYNSDWEQISQSIGIGDYKKFVIDDEKNLILGKQCPVSVQSIARFNYLAHKNGEDSKKIYSGKIKYYNIRLGSRYDDIGYFGFPSGELPSWAPKIDLQTQWCKNVVDPINRFLEVMDIPMSDITGHIQQTLF